MGRGTARTGENSSPPSAKFLKLSLLFPLHCQSFKQCPGLNCRFLTLPPAIVVVNKTLMIAPPALKIQVVIPLQAGSVPKGLTGRG